MPILVTASSWFLWLCLLMMPAVFIMPFSRLVLVSAMSCKENACLNERISKILHWDKCCGCMTGAGCVYVSFPHDTQFSLRMMDPFPTARTSCRGSISAPVNCHCSVYITWVSDILYQLPICLLNHTVAS